MDQGNGTRRALQSRLSFFGKTVFLANCKGGYFSWYVRVSLDSLCPDGDLWVLDVGLALDETELLDARLRRLGRHVAMTPDVIQGTSQDGL